MTKISKDAPEDAVARMGEHSVRRRALLAAKSPREKPKHSPIEVLSSAEVSSRKEKSARKRDESELQSDALLSGGVDWLNDERIRRKSDGAKRTGSAEPSGDSAAAQSRQAPSGSAR